MCLASLLLLSACAVPTADRQQPSTTPVAATATAAPLPLGCPDGASPITSNTRVALQPDRGPVGSTINVLITGARPNCHLTLNIAVPPALSETQNTPVATPGLSYPIQWITLSAEGTLTLPTCVCATMSTWTNDAPQITSVTPQPGASGVGDYAPKPNDYFFFTLGGGEPSASSPVFAVFTVTG